MIEKHHGEKENGRREQRVKKYFISKKIDK
jgi:hypothetical protein